MKGQPREFKDFPAELHDLPRELFFKDKGPIGKHLEWEDMAALDETSQGVQQAVEPAFRVRKEFLKRQKNLDEKILQILRKFSHKLERGSVLHWRVGQGDAQQGYVWKDDFKDGFHDITFNLVPGSMTILPQKLKFKLYGDLATSPVKMGGNLTLLDPDIVEARAEMEIVDEMRREFPKKFEHALQEGTILRISFIEGSTTDYIVLKDEILGNAKHQTLIKKLLGNSETPEISIKYSMNRSDSYVYNPSPRKPRGIPSKLRIRPPTPFERSIVQIR